MENQPSWALLARYVSGACAPDEARQVEAWMRADPARRQLVEELRDLWDAAASPPPQAGEEIDVEAGWRQVRAEMTSEEPDGSVPEPDRSARPRRPRGRARRPSRWRGPGWRAGAVVGLLLLVGGLWLAQSLWPSAEAPADTAYRTVVTKPGERSQVQLADGSSVMLNVDSKLRLPSTFNQQMRTVELTGEAYFEVEARPDRPFVVRTEDASVEVRGTAFNVRGYPDEEQVQVAVAEGGVSVRPTRKEGASAAVRLASGEVGWMADTDTTVQTLAADVATYIGWTKGRLVFEDTPLPRVARRLERWYDLEFRIRDPELRSLRLTATLKSQSVRNVLDVITASLDIRYQIDRNSVVLTARDGPR
jgi:ferric-dicitrate binding protein FerR (iron transport regulator)